LLISAVVLRLSPGQEGSHEGGTCDVELVRGEVGGREVVVLAVAFADRLAGFGVPPASTKMLLKKNCLRGMFQMWMVNFLCNKLSSKTLKKVTQNIDNWFLMLSDRGLRMFCIIL
jgi:hypothetical protein